MAGRLRCCELPVPCSFGNRGFVACCGEGLGERAVKIDFVEVGGSECSVIETVVPTTGRWFD